MDATEQSDTIHLALMI